MATFNRGRLRRLVEQCRIVMVGSYHFDDMLGEDRGEHEGANAVPCFLHPETQGFRGETGLFFMREHDFTGKSGRAYESGPPGQIHLTVHSNCNYELRQVTPEEHARCTARALRRQVKKWHYCDEQAAVMAGRVTPEIASRFMYPVGHPWHAIFVNELQRLARDAGAEGIRSALKVPDDTASLLARGD